MRGRGIVVVGVVAGSLALAGAAHAGPTPKLKDLGVKLDGSKPGSSYKVTVKAKVRACSREGPLRIEVVEQKTGFDHPPTVVAQNTRSFVRGHRSPCESYKVDWTLGEKFFGIGVYKVRVRVVDADGDRSRSLVQSFKTSD